MLGLATGLAAWPLDPAMPLQGTARSQSCGSTLAISLTVDGAGAICALGLRAQACAVGQASAAIFARAATGRTRADLARSAEAIAGWLAGGAPMPDWPGLAAIAPAAAYPARHGAILLAWKAALAALPTA
ncbi:iron-sulfur cluster assembly scaffold protein [Novosphingobium flavum]|uniref:Iron-sulfur cluster assembly scaffold protein n=1 Tax=Novosphingobium flavum TaxID=1778672 RepID=A0A7X1FQJ6_9SPHN|nr:iron-sulfur cluster assembly scaffold protein [Novosphingobium flavum]